MAGFFEDVSFEDYNFEYCLGLDEGLEDAFKLDIFRLETDLVFVLFLKLGYSIVRVSLDFVFSLVQDLVFASGSPRVLLSDGR